MGRRVRLLEVFKDVDPIIKGMSGQRRYTAYYRLVPKQVQGLTKHELLERVEKYVEGLRQKYPDKEFYHYICRIDGREYVVVTKKKYVKGEGGAKVRQWDRCPVYISLDDFKAYVPAYYYKIKPKLCNYILMRVLGTLGLATLKNVGRAPPGEAPAQVASQ
jgi:hypothetical protein